MAHDPLNFSESSDFPDSWYIPFPLTLPSSLRTLRMIHYGHKCNISDNFHQDAIDRFILSLRLEARAHGHDSADPEPSCEPTSVEAYNSTGYDIRNKSLLRPIANGIPWTHLGDDCRSKGLGVYEERIGNIRMAYKRVLWVPPPVYYDDPTHY